MAVLTTLLLVASLQAGAPERPRVFIFTATSPGGAVSAGGAVDSEAQGRLDSVRDLREALRRERKIQLVTERSEADVVVEVLSREKRDMPLGGFGGTSVTPSGEVVIRISAGFAERQTEMRGTAVGYWSKAAKDTAERLLKWILRRPVTALEGREGRV